MLVAACRRAVAEAGRKAKKSGEVHSQPGKLVGRGAGEYCTLVEHEGISRQWSIVHKRGAHMTSVQAH